MIARSVRRLIATSPATLALASLVAQSQVVDWAAAGRDLAGTRYLPATEITRDNVAQLEIAWTYRTGETGERFATTSETAFETTPLVVDGVMYLNTPLGRVIALGAETGEELWVFDPHIARDVPYGDFASRGVATWLDDAAADSPACQRRIFVSTPESDLYAIDARRGAPCRELRRQR